MTVAATTCTPNFSATGRVRRQRVALVTGASAAVLFAVLAGVGAPPAVRLLVALPAATAFVTWLQVRRDTCVMHAATGTFEREDFSVEKVDAARAAASKKVAAGILRDGILAGLAVGLAAFATGFLG